MVREAVVSGQFYNSDLTELENQIKQSFTSKYGPGALPAKRKQHKISAVIVPHAGYMFSGSCAAWAYKEIAEAKFPDLFILLGPNHHGTGSGMSIEDWKTPLGIVRTDKNFAETLEKNSSIQINEFAHRFEHSIEVQLPFLQFVNKDKIQELKILSIAIDHDVDFKEISNQINSVVNQSKKNVIFIVSSDFTHYGRNYGYLPFTLDVPERLNKLDGEAIEHIRSLNIDGFRNFINKTGATICGYLPILVLLNILQKIKPAPIAHLLSYYTSADIIGDYSNSVSYASILFK